jgi:hypothetical protein
MGLKRKTTRAKLKKRPAKAPLNRSFLDFARRLRPTNPPLKMFRERALAADFPAADSWQEVRGFLVRTGAEHEAIVGARMAWREYQSKSL